MSEIPARFVTDFLGPEYDASIQPPAAPVRSYIVCSTPRSGSGLLSRGLAATGALGSPLEYFNPIHRKTLAGRWRCGAELSGYVDSLHSRRSTAAGLFGAKVHWDQMTQVRAEATGEADDRFTHAMSGDLLESLFPAPCFIRIVRLDLDRQAVSYWRALNSNVWSLGLDESADGEGDVAPYSFEGIDRCRRAIENGELCWERLIREQKREALVVTYEDLASAFAQTIEYVASYISPGLVVNLPSPATRKLSDERSAEILDRFRADRVTRRSASSGH